MAYRPGIKIVKPVGESMDKFEETLNQVDVDSSSSEHFFDLLYVVSLRRHYWNLKATRTSSLYLGKSTSRKQK